MEGVESVGQLSAKAGKPYAVLHIDAKGTCSIPQFCDVDQVVAILQPKEVKRGRCVPCVCHTVVARRADGSWLVETWRV